MMLFLSVTNEQNQLANMLLGLCLLVHRNVILDLCSMFVLVYQTYYKTRAMLLGDVYSKGMIWSFSRDFHKLDLEFISIVLSL